MNRSILLLVSWCLCGGSLLAAPAPPQGSQEKEPDLRTLPLYGPPVYGPPVAAKDLEGKGVLVVFWDEGCNSCKQEALEQFAQMVREQEFLKKE